MLWFQSLFLLSPARFSFRFSTSAWIPPEFELLRTCSMSKHISHSQSTNWKFHSTKVVFYRRPPLEGLFQTDLPIGSFHEYPQDNPRFIPKSREGCAGAVSEASLEPWELEYDVCSQSEEPNYRRALQVITESKVRRGILVVFLKLRRKEESYRGICVFTVLHWFHFKYTFTTAGGREDELTEMES